MSSTLDHQFFRTASPKDVALHLHNLASEMPGSLDLISQELLHAITSGSLLPSTFALWTSACPDESATIAGMRCSESSIVRSSAIRNFRRRLRTAKCEHMWRALGGTEGVTALLAEFSVIHVKEFCKGVARCSTSTHARGERQLLVTDLLQSLISASQQPGTGHHGFMDQYAKLVYTCTPDFRNDWIAKNGSSKLDMRKLIECDTARYQDECLQAITNYNPSKTPRLNVYLPLLKSIPGIPHYEDSSISESMAFSVRVLKAVSQANVSEMWKDRAWLDDVIRSLLKRIVRRKTPMRRETMKNKEISTRTKVSTNFALEALEAISQCLQHDPEPGEVRYGAYKTPEDHRYWRNILHLWRRDPSIYEAALTPLLQAYDFCVELKASGYRLRHDSRAKITITQQILATYDEQRYSLLRWLLANQSGYRFDIEDCSQVAGKADRFYPMDDILPVDILLALPSADVLPLLERFQTYCPGKLSLDVNGLSVLDREPRVELLRLHLRDDVEAVHYDAKSQTKHSQQMAENSGAQPVRSAWITASIYFAVASHSLALLQEVVIWARRFSRDPKTVVELYGEGKAFENERTLCLLSGVPTRFDPDTNVHEAQYDVQQNVRKGNEVILTLLHSAIEAQSDSSFKPWHWESVKLLFRRVIGFRLASVNNLQAKLYLADGATFDCIWKDTIKTLIKAEELGLSPDNASLELRNMSGLLQYGHGPSGHAAVPKDLLAPATLRFIDELAVLRDRLWTTHRAKEFPAVTALQPPWTRGLPLQALLFPHGADLARHYLPEQGWNVGVAANVMPFLEKRAIDVVFMASEHALGRLPTDEETVSAIGSFIDDYSFALYIYISVGKEDERKQRLEDAWTHATQNLSGSRVSALESVAYWREPFAAARALLPTSTKDHEPVSLDLRLPMMNQNSISPVEWSPQPQIINAALSSKVLEPLVIDCFAKPPAAWPSKGPANTIQGCKPSLSSIDITNVWDVKSLMAKGIRVSIATKEALIAAALLLVDGRSQAESNIFSEPYPPTTAPRLPAMVLDAQLLDSKELSDENVIAILERFMPAVPPSLLYRLAIRLVKKSLHASPTSKTVREWTSAVLKLLGNSDHIDIATDLIVDVVLDAPGETPWHRILLHSGTLRRLSHDKCKQLMQRLFAGVIARLQEQARVEAAVTQADKIEMTPGSYSPSTSLVKVTTVKMLAHLLKDSTFLGERFIIDCLFAVFEAAKHIYVRATVVDSLSAVLTSSCD